MGRKCLVCSRPENEKAEIEKRLAEGHVLREISDDFDLSVGCLFRHKVSHMEPLEAQQKKQATMQVFRAIEALSLDQFLEYERKYPGVFQKYKESKKLGQLESKAAGNPSAQ